MLYNYYDIQLTTVDYCYFSHLFHFPVNNLNSLHFFHLKLMLKLKFVWSSFTLLFVHHVSRLCFAWFMCFYFSYFRLNRYWELCFQWEKLTTTDWECTPHPRTDDGASTQQYASFKGMWPLKNYYIAYYTDSTGLLVDASRAVHQFPFYGLVRTHSSVRF